MGNEQAAMEMRNKSGQKFWLKFGFFGFFSGQISLLMVSLKFI